MEQPLYAIAYRRPEHPGATLYLSALSAPEDNSPCVTPNIEQAMLFDCLDDALSWANSCASYHRTYLPAAVIQVDKVPCQYRLAAGRIL